MKFQIHIRKAITDFAIIEVEAHKTITNAHGHLVFVNEDNQLQAMFKDWVMVKAVYDDEPDVIPIGDED